MNARDLIFHLAYNFINFFHTTPLKTFTENNFTLFYATFSPIGIVEGIIYNISNMDIWSKWLLDELIISLHTFERKYFNKIFPFFYI